MPVHDRISAAQGLAAGSGYANVVTASGRLAFIAGQVALDENGRLVGGDDLAAQTRQALANLAAALRAVGADRSHVVRFNWYVRDVTQVQVVRVGGHGCARLVSSCSTKRAQEAAWADAVRVLCRYATRDAHTAVTG